MNSKNNNFALNKGGEKNYRLENIIKREKKLAAMRKHIIGLDSSQALDAILSSDMPATLIQSFPEQDFYFLMYHIGPDDFLPVLSLASFEQWEYILDMEVWDNDRLNIPQMTRNFGLLFKADPKRLMRWLINDKPELIEYYLFKNIQVRIREHDEDPSSFEDGYTTIDDVFYVKFPDIPESLSEYSDEKLDLAQLKKDRQESEELISEMLNTVADMDLAVYHSLLLESCSIIAAETEEDQLRQRNIRLAEKGFSPHYEAVGIYQPISFENMRKKSSKYIKAPVYGTGLPLPPQYPSELLSDYSLFAKSLGLVEDEVRINIEMEFTALVNRLISADNKIIREKDDLEKMIQKACAYLDLGLGLIHGGNGECMAGNGAAIIKKYWLEDIFRIASAAGVKLKSKAEKWYMTSFPKQNNLPLSFLGEQWFGLIGGLFLDRPMYFDNYKSGRLYREFASPLDIKNTDEELNRLIAFDEIFILLAPELKNIMPLDSICDNGADTNHDCAGNDCENYDNSDNCEDYCSNGNDYSINAFNINYKNVLLTLWVRDRLGMDALLAPIPVDKFKLFFNELLTYEKENHGKTKTDNKKTIDINKRKDLVLWLLEHPSIKKIEEHRKEKLLKTIYPVLEGLFDELENEYGIVSSEDIDPRFVLHFLLQ